MWSEREDLRVDLLVSAACFLQRVLVLAGAELALVLVADDMLLPAVVLQGLGAPRDGLGAAFARRGQRGIGGDGAARGGSAAAGAIGGGRR